jgi:hypothetical protein
MKIPATAFNKLLLFFFGMSVPNVGGKNGDQYKKTSSTVTGRE